MLCFTSLIAKSSLEFMASTPRINGNGAICKQFDSSKSFNIH